jgi:hypothetical protein
MHATDADIWSNRSPKCPGSAWRHCLNLAIQAPSLLNTQPWRFHVHAGGVDVFTDPQRRLDAIDPRGREMVLSVAAAIFNLRVGVLALGRQPLVAAIPDPAQTNLLARVTLGPSVQPDRLVRALAQAIPKRHTSRVPFADTAVPPEVLTGLADAAHVEGCGLAEADDIGRMLVLGLVRRAEQKLHAEPRYRAAVARWAGPAGARDGVSPEEFGPLDALDEMPIRILGWISRARTVSGHALSRSQSLRCYTPAATRHTSGCKPARHCSGCCSRQRCTDCPPHP